MPSNHLVLCHPLLLLPSIFPSTRVFSNKLALPIRWPKYWSFSFSVSPSNECSLGPVRSLGREDPLEKELATHSSILAWRILWTEEPGGLQSMGSQRVGHDRATELNLQFQGPSVPISLQLILRIVEAHILDIVWSSCS